MGRSIALAIVFACRLVLADSVFDQVAGRYPVYAVDGNEHITGAIEISSTAKGVGYRLSELPKDFEAGTTPLVLLTPLKDTVIKKEGNQIVQEYRSDDLSVRIEYERRGNQLIIQASECPKNGNCHLSIVNNGNGIGDPVEARTYFESIKGKYKIDLAGGAAPHGGVTGDLSLSSDEANFTLPYCAESGGSCDPGYIDMTLKDTKVIKRSIDRGQTIATIVWDGKVYTWEERAEKIYFRNYQYENAEGNVSILSHELSRLP